MLAQSIEHQTFNLRVKGSSPLQGVGIETIFSYFKTIFGCNYLCVLLQVDPEIRIRFTSPHPKDFPNEVSLPLSLSNTPHTTLVLINRLVSILTPAVTSHERPSKCL